MGKFFEGVYEDLSLHVRTLAWWHAVPVDQKANERNEKSRLREATDRDETFEPPLPQFEQEFEYLLQALFEAGPVSATGAGSGALTWVDLQAWSAATGIELRPWELRVIRRLSADYASESHKAEKPGYPCPFEWTPNTQYLDSVAASMRASLAGDAAM